MTLVGYTLGDPNAYEPMLDEDGPVHKAPGGCFFATIHDAMEALEMVGGEPCLPREWFPDCEPLPGRVYELHTDREAFSLHAEPMKWQKRDGPTCWALAASLEVRRCP